MLPQRAPDAVQRIDRAPLVDERRLARDLPHQLVHVFELLQRGPVLVAPAPLGSRVQPHRKRLGEVLVGMALRVPVVDVQDEAAAVRLGRVELGVLDGDDPNIAWRRRRRRSR